MEELLEIFKQVEEMVEAQGHTIDNIERDILKAEVHVHYGNLGCRVLKEGMQNDIAFWPTINILKGNYCILSVDTVANCQKVPESDIQSQFYMSKINGIFQIFFSFKNIILGAHFLFFFKDTF